MGRGITVTQTNNHISVEKQVAGKRQAVLRCPVDLNQNGVRQQDEVNRQSPRKLIGINGLWYDVTGFVKRHPGGPILEQFIGKDATEVYNEFHGGDVLKHRKPVGKYKRMPDPAAVAFARLHKYFVDNGYFRTSWCWYLTKVTFTFSLLAMCFYLVTRQENLYHYLGAVFLAAFWQQCGFLMHDSMHTQISHVPYIDKWLGTFFGTVCFGVNAHWWRAEHIIHHALTNTVDYVTGFCDPQSKEVVWAQNEKLFPFFEHWLQYYAIKIQHITFVPFTVCLGRIGIAIDSFMSETCAREWVACALHYAWVYYILSLLPTWRTAAIFYYMAAVLQGVLHVQLLINHYSKPFYEREQVCRDINWYRMQIECNINIRNPWWFDWFHGGLNFHIEHHLFPLMPRHNFRRASKHVKRTCAELGIVYAESGWFETVQNTIKNLKRSSKHFRLDPR